MEQSDVSVGVRGAQPGSGARPRGRNGMSRIDCSLDAVGRGLATLASALPSVRPSPAGGVTDHELATEERAVAAALMRVNHVGEVCAQALYDGQAAGARDPLLREVFRRAAQEEIDHLAWTRERITRLGGRPSLLNPLWYAGAYALGFLASRAGDRVSLGFMAETERQVEHHLATHLQRLPARDLCSLAVVAQMKADEAVHAQTAEELGASVLPPQMRTAMRIAALAMTSTAYWI